eukprot:m.89781 g.89781  ORF g.89781 m.89781 type:complete len:517 (-) comp26332_c0_seq2:210-1760(-)
MLQLRGLNHFWIPVIIVCAFVVSLFNSVYDVPTFPSDTMVMDDQDARNVNTVNTVNTVSSSDIERETHVSDEHVRKATNNGDVDIDAEHPDATETSPLSTSRDNQEPQGSFCFLVKNKDISPPPFGHDKDASLLSLDPQALVKHAASCLQLTTPSIALEYPTDPEAHFEEFHVGMLQWLEDRPHCVSHEDGKEFCGPWIENVWIRTFGSAYCAQPIETRKLAPIFGPFIPLLVPWVDRWVNNSDHPWKYPKNMIKTLKSLLRPSVPYITVSQNDEGLVATCNEGLNHKDIPNVLVLSAGGHGHVPIPLVKQTQSPSSVSLTNVDPIPFADRNLLISFFGTEKTTQRSGKLRSYLCNVVKTVAKKFNFSHRVCEIDPEWRSLMRHSKASLLPRGYGRSSYRVDEAIQMGLIPVFVYDDVPWVPYESYWSKFGYVANLSEIPKLLVSINNTSTEELERKEIEVRKFAKSHYSWEGVVQQITNFMTQTNGGGDLKCQRLPACPRNDVVGCPKQCRWETL